MPAINVAAVLVSAAASVVGSTAWYGLLGARMVSLQQRWRGRSGAQQPAPAGQLAVAAATSIVLALCVAILVGLTETTGVLPLLGLAALLWVGFVLTQWASSLMGEQVPVALAAIHAGDWLVHLVVITLIVGTWR
ncbi:DUF1761 domain-containing protein [Georgenia sp. TF02-10]|uniref:DUF1761 domain-containing protein n=1 Tax=Georgenia sp. TF02-10 TaxID=2917725 RepID=UPI001FA7B43C|nr:DUF1761 domain-containing protein [Georgenia sp. TF02-10]UNX54432.1 DUF1761 domain-containing protein [Georgenia sp. TF02-10]